MNAKDIVKYTENLTEKDLEWKPLYPNNMLCNRQCGWYCFLWLKNKEGTYHGRKYTILFQEKEDEKGCTQRGEPDLFILFEKLYNDMKTPLVYHEPSEKPIMTLRGASDCFDINSYGSFVRAYTSENKARERALRQYKMVFSYAMSYLVEKEDEK